MLSFLRGSLAPAYKPKFNLSVNFDLNIGMRFCKPTSSTSVDTTDTFVLTPPSPFHSLTLKRLISSLELSYSSSNSDFCLPSLPVIIPIGSFLLLNSIKDVKKFDDSFEEAQ